MIKIYHNLYIYIIYIYISISISCRHIKCPWALKDKCHLQYANECPSPSHDYSQQSCQDMYNVVLLYNTLFSGKKDKRHAFPRTRKGKYGNAYIDYIVVSISKNLWLTLPGEKQTDAFCISEKIGRARSLGNSCLVSWPLGGGQKRSNMPRKQNRKECRHRASSRRQGDKWRHCAKSQGPSSENNLWTSNYTRKLEKGHSVHWAQRMATQK